MAVYPKGDKWMASFGAGATRVRKTFKTEAEGVAWEEAQEGARGALKALPEAPKAAPKCWTLQQAFDSTLLHQWRGKGGERKAIINASQALAFFGPDTPTSAIDAGRILGYMGHLIQQGNSFSTMNKKQSALRVMLVRALHYGGLEKLPLLKRYKEDRTPARWLNDDDERDMLAMCMTLGYTDLHDFIVVGFHTGYRKGELLGLKPEHYHDGTLLLEEGDTKSDEPRAIPCSPKVRQIVEWRIAMGADRIFWGLTESILRGQWEDLRSKMGRNDDPKFTIHKMRHACATRLVSEGVDMKTIQVWMGHENIETTMRYAHLDKGRLEAAGKKLEARLPTYRA